MPKSQVPAIARSMSRKASGNPSGVRCGEVETNEYNRDKGIGVTIYLGQRKGARQYLRFFAGRFARPSTPTSPVSRRRMPVPACRKKGNAGNA